MSAWTLALTRLDDSPDFEVELVDKFDRIKELNEAKKIKAEEEKKVYSDWSYKFILKSDEKVTGVEIYICGAYQESTYKDNTITFDENEGRIFSDCYGLVDLQLKVTLENGEEINLYSQDLPVLVKENDINKKLHNSVGAMIDFMYDNHIDLLTGSEVKSKRESGIEKKGYQNLETKIGLAGQIADKYASNSGYFMVNSRTQIEKTPAVDHIEKVRYFTPDTLRYIASHPEHLKRVNSEAGVRVDKWMYHPQKALSPQNTFSYNVYENRVILSFLQKMIYEIDNLRAKCEAMVGGTDDEKDGDYRYSAPFKFAKPGKLLKESAQRLRLLKNRYDKLLHIYERELGVSPEPLLSKPRPTPVFLNIPQYKEIFMLIYKWFDEGIYASSEEKYMMPLAKMPVLYERYLLAKMISYFKNEGYELEDEFLFKYKSKSSWEYFKNPEINDKFIFEKNGFYVTLYYQPVIYNGEIHNDGFDNNGKKEEIDFNGIDLFRNSHISGSKNPKEGEGDFYWPDFVIKFERGEKADYMILDAKFSNRDNVYKYYVKDLVFKYLFSLSPIKDTDSISGMCIIYGKSTDEKEPESVYNKLVKGKKIKPFVYTLQMMENPDGSANPDHFKNLGKLMKQMY